MESQILHNYRNESLLKTLQKAITPERFFLLSVLFVNGLNYLYNLILGRMVGPTEFSDVALIVTMLLIFSFMASTFQIVATKYTIQLEEEQKIQLYHYLSRNALGIGVVFMALFIIFSQPLQNLFHTNNSNIFILFGISIPIYFLLSINRGIFQGKQNFQSLSYTYIFEALVKLVASISLIYFVGMQSSLAVSLAVLGSIVIAWFPSNLKWKFFKYKTVNSILKKKIMLFFSITLMYELIQVLINSSDIFIVKAFFPAQESGLYSSLALIGRMVYVMSWMLVMIILPKIIEKDKNGEDSYPLLFKNIFIIIAVTSIMVLFTYLNSETIVQYMFGSEYLSIHPLLYKYAIATSLFALNNLLVYYFLSKEVYMPVYIALFFSIVQIITLSWFHNSLEEVVEMQIYVMAVFLLVMINFLWEQKSSFHVKIL